MGYTCKDCGWKPEVKECVGTTGETIDQILDHEKTHRKKYQCEYK